MCVRPKLMAPLLLPILFASRPSSYVLPNTEKYNRQVRHMVRIQQLGPRYKKLLVSLILLQNPLDLLFTLNLGTIPFLHQIWELECVAEKSTREYNLILLIRN